MLPTISPFLLNAFSRYAAWYVPRHFHAVRLLAASGPPAVDERPVVVYLNHPSWWDPLICLLLVRRFWPDRKHYAPIDAVAIRRYRFFQRLGFFGVEQNNAAGSLAFLRTARAILEQPAAMLWLTAQGQFTDVRRRPISLRPGLGHLLRHVGRALVVPLAVEYCFWDERHPEALAAFGEPIEITSEHSRRPSEWTALLEQHLEQAANLLAAGATSRDPANFVMLHSGTAGVSFVYDAWLRAKALATGRPYHREHGAGIR
jgi:1-acyl-sn-glycerol-3-phosphate acyltransferase